MGSLVLMLGLILLAFSTFFTGLTEAGSAVPLNYPFKDCLSPALMEINNSEAPPIQLGDTGQAVSDLQLILQYWGYYEGPINGIFDEATQDALMAFELAFNNWLILHPEFDPGFTVYVAGIFDYETSIIMAGACSGRFGQQFPK